MSESNESKIEKQLKLLIPLGWALLVGAFGMGGWLATVEYRHRGTEKVAEENKVKVGQFEIWKASTEASRFNTKDGMGLQREFTQGFATIQDLANQQDRRIQKLESSNEFIKESLKRIETELGTN